MSSVDSPPMQELVDILSSLKSDLASFNTTAGQAIDKKKLRLKSRNFNSATSIEKYSPTDTKGQEHTPDPWFFPANGELKTTPEMGTVNVFQASEISGTPWVKAATGRQQKYVSLGKVISIFVIEPLIGSNRFDEVQCFSYSFNVSASYMRGQNIASFPINISTFNSKLDDLMKKFPQVSCQRFISFIALGFVNSMASEAYGFSALFETKDGKTTIKKEKSRGI